MSMSSGARLELKISKTTWSGHLREVCDFRSGVAGDLFSCGCLSSRFLEFRVLGVFGFSPFTLVFSPLL